MNFLLLKSLMKKIQNTKNKKIKEYFDILEII